MNFLNLAQMVRQEAGIAGSGPTTTIGQSGELGRVVSYVAQAYQEIQDRRADWEFLRNNFSFMLTIGQAYYPISTVTNLAEWKRDSFRLYLASAGLSDERWIRFVPWQDFRDSRLRGSAQLLTGRPIEFSIDPQKRVVTYPIPDQAYTIDGEYFAYPAVMALDTDVPIFDRFHMAIVYNALMRYAAYIADPTTYARAQHDYRIQIGKLERTWQPEMTLGEPLA